MTPDPRPHLALRGGWWRVYPHRGARRPLVAFTLRDLAEREARIIARRRGLPIPGNP